MFCNMLKKPQVQTYSSYAPASQFKQTVRTREHKPVSGYEAKNVLACITVLFSCQAWEKHFLAIPRLWPLLYEADYCSSERRLGGEVTPKTWENQVKHGERYQLSSSPVCQSHPPQNMVHWEMILIKRPFSHDLVVYQDIRVVFSFEPGPGWHCTCSLRIPLIHYALGHGCFYGRPHMFLEHMDSVGYTNVCMKIWQAFLGDTSLIAFQTPSCLSLGPHRLFAAVMEACEILC